MFANNLQKIKPVESFVNKIFHSIMPLPRPPLCRTPARQWLACSSNLLFVNCSEKSKSHSVITQQQLQQKEKNNNNHSVNTNFIALWICYVLCMLIALQFVRTRRKLRYKQLRKRSVSHWLCGGPADDEIRYHHTSAHTHTHTCLHPSVDCLWESQSRHTHRRSDNPFAFQINQRSMSGNVLFLIRTGDIKITVSLSFFLFLSLSLRLKKVLSSSWRRRRRGERGDWLTCLRQLNWLVDWWAAQSDDYRAVLLGNQRQLALGLGLGLGLGLAVGLWHGLSSALHWHVGDGSLCVFVLPATTIASNLHVVRASVDWWQVATAGAACRQNDAQSPVKCTTSSSHHCSYAMLHTPAGISIAVAAAATAAASMSVAALPTKSDSDNVLAANANC